MTLADLLVSFAGFYGPAREALRRERAIEDRATYIRDRRPISRDDARAIAEFSLGDWSRDYPVRGHDLGEGFALHVADWLAARALGATVDNMDGAFRDWQGGAFYGWMMLAIVGG